MSNLTTTQFDHRKDPIFRSIVYRPWDRLRLAFIVFPITFLMVALGIGTWMTDFTFLKKIILSLVFFPLPIFDLVLPIVSGFETTIGDGILRLRTIILGHSLGSPIRIPLNTISSIYETKYFGRQWTAVIFHGQRMLPLIGYCVSQAQFDQFIDAISQQTPLRLTVHNGGLRMRTRTRFIRGGSAWPHYFPVTRGWKQVNTPNIQETLGMTAFGSIRTTYFSADQYHRERIATLRWRWIAYIGGGVLVIGYVYYVVGGPALIDIGRIALRMMHL